MTRVPLPPLDDPVPVVVAPWEIECCHPPPVVGEFTTWRLRLRTGRPAGDWLPPAVSRLRWSVTEWPGAGRPHRMLTRGGLVAMMDGHPRSGGPPPELPPPGRHRVTGVLAGSGHGGNGETDDGPLTTAVVHSLAVVTSDYSTYEHSWVADASLYELRPVLESPRWFTDRPVPDTGRIRRSHALVMWLT